MNIRLLVSFGVLMELCYLCLYFAPEGAGSVLFLLAVNVAVFLLLSFLVWQLRKGAFPGSNQNSLLAILVAFGILFRITVVPHQVIGSDDIYRYLWDGKVAASGINPFAYLPTDPRLARLASADLPAKVNHPELRTVYPPLAQGLFFVAHVLFGSSPAALKLLLVVLDSGTMLLLLSLLRRIGGSPCSLLLYAWSPLPVLYFGLDGHIDALALFFLILSLYYFAKDRPLVGSVAVGIGGLAKLVPLLIVPLLLRMEKGWRRVALIFLPGLILVAGYLLYLEPTWGVFDALGTFGARWEFNGSLFSIVYFLSGSNETAHRVSGLLLVAFIAVLALLDRPMLEKVFWGFVGFILLSPVVHPWYLTWLAALLVLRWSVAVFLWLGLSAIANVVVYQYRAYGQWVDQPLLLLIEYVPVYVLIVWEALRGGILRKSSPARNGAA